MNIANNFFSYCTVAERIKNFNIRKDDVFVLTFPKSGTTWMSELLWLLMNDLDFDTAKSEYIMLRIPFIEYLLIFKIYFI